MDKYYFIILNKFKNKMVYSEENISEYVRDYFSSQDYSKNPWIRTGLLYHSIDEVLSSLLSTEHFISVNNTNKDMILGQKGWIESIDVVLKITPKGVLFLYEKKKIDTSSFANKLTLGVIIATLLVGLLNYYTTITQQCRMPQLPIEKQIQKPTQQKKVSATNLNSKVKNP